MNILVIGSKGFIGSNCYERLKTETYLSVFGADVAVDYNDPNYTTIDATNADFRILFTKHSFDWCINCSGASSVPDSFSNPKRDYLLNVYNVALILNAIKEFNPLCKFIQLSSAAVYGNPQRLPITEQAVLRPISPYGMHKKQAEEICDMYYRHFNVVSIVIRIFSAYGPGLKKQLFWDLYLKTKKSNSIELFGTGKETRAFINIFDIVNAILTILNTQVAEFEIINLANEKSNSIEEASRLFLKKIAYNGDLYFNGIIRDGDPLYWQADVTKLSKFGYKQSVNFENGISEYCQWLQERE